MKFKKRKSQLKSINRVLLKHFLLLSVLLICLLEVICFLIVNNTAKSTAKERLIRVGREAAELVDDEAEATEFIRNYRQDGIIVYVLSQSGEVLLPSDETVWNGDMREIIEKLDKEDKESAQVIYSQDNALNYAMRLDYGGGSYLVATYSLGIINGASRLLLVYFVIVGVTVLLLTAMVAYNVSQKLSSGLKNLSTTAVRFSEGDFAVNFANAEYQELADLSDTLNSVRDEVKKSADLQRS